MMFGNKMDRDTYLKELKNYIQALPLEEQEEALEYYRDYFDDADDDEKVIKELGSPEKLAEEIKEKFACVPAEMRKEKAQEKQKEAEPENDEGYYVRNALRFEFDEANVKNMDLSLGAAEIVMISGDRYRIETRGIDSMAFRCQLSEKGTLLVDNKKTFSGRHFFSHDDNASWKPRILITVPENARLDIVKIGLAAGSFVTKSVALHCNTAFLDVAAGNLVVDRIYGGRTDIHCGMGNVEMTGTVTGNCDIDCGMGKITMKLSGNPDDYSFGAKVGLGDVKFNRTKKSGIGTLCCEYRKKNHLSVNCGMGSVDIDMR